MNVLDLAPLLAYPVLTGVVIALTQAAKRLVSDSRWYPIIAIGLGVAWTVGLTYAAYGPSAFPDSVFSGVAVGLAAAGLYDVGNKTVKLA